VRSTDRGATWSQPRVAPDYGWTGVENPGVMQLRNGDLLFNQWQFRWTPLELGRALSEQGAGEYYVCPDDGPNRHRWRLPTSDADWDRHPYPYVRSDGGAYVHISSDNGATWPVTVPVDARPYRGAFSPKGAVELADGTIVLALGSNDHDPLLATFALHSTDGGKSWGKLVEIARAEGCEFYEPSVTVTRSGKLVCFSREEKSGHLHQSDSFDGGLTWSEPRKLDLWGYPAHVITLADGRLLGIYGVRRAPYGIRVSVSEDEGLSWGPEIILRDDFPDENLGYPSVIEYEPGKLFTVYYGEDTDGTTCLHGTYFTV
jgi:BNR repeat-like domain